MGTRIRPRISQDPKLRPEQDVLAVHTRHHCHSGREEEKKMMKEDSSTEEVGASLVQKMLHDIATPASVGEVAQ